jgi:hypothetical protein
MRALRRFIPHPWLFVMSLLAIFLFILASFFSPSDNLFDIIAWFFIPVWAGTWISSVVVAVRERHWLWFMTLLVTWSLGVIFFSIFDQPNQKSAAATPTPP